MLKKRGANFGRLHSEFVIPLVSRVTDILSRRGKIPPIKVDGREVALTMESPLAALEQSENIDNLMVYLNLIGMLPENVALLGASLESVPQFAQKNLNLPEELSRTPDQIKAAQEQLLSQVGGNVGQPAPV